MAAGNQTRLGFLQQKPGSRRILDSKRAKAAVPSTDADKDTQVAANNNDASPPSSEELLLQRVGRITRTMEEKLAAYKKAKEEKAALRATQAESRSLRSRSATREVNESTTVTISTTTQKSLQQSTKLSSLISKNQTSLNFKRISSSNTTTKEERTVTIGTQTEERESFPSRDGTSSVAKHVGKGIAPEEVEGKHLEETSAADNFVDDDDTLTNKDLAAPEEAIQPVVPKSTGKPIAEDTVFQPEGTLTKDTEEVDDDDNIHPLARTVVKSAPRPTKFQTDEESGTSASISNHQKVDTHASTSIPSRMARKPIVQEPIAAETLLPLPSHMAVLLANFTANFEIKHLAQFKTLLPEAYKFTEAPCLFEGVKTRSIHIEMLELKDESEVFVPQADKRYKLLIERLYDHIKPFHEKFLKSTTPARTNTFPHSWHPDFDLESVSPVDEADIPLLKPAVVDVSHINLRDLGSRRDLGQRIAKGESPSVSHTSSSPIPATASTSSPSSTKEVRTSITAADVANVAPDSPAVKVLSKLEQLKERIRLKQLEKMESGKGLATPEEKRERLIASRLPSVFDLIRFKRVEVMPIKSLVDQVVKSSRMPISEVEGKESLEMLARVLPEWCSVFSLADGQRYFKVLRDDGQGNKIVHDEKALRARLVVNSTSRP
ncbi:hypothetical protein EDD11_009547 [Mortierella claussenii]|nr:hypothetical protein EDD11_009547 [Mortierella claussenii]